MRASGYIVLSLDDDPHVISKPFEIETGPIISTCTFGECTEITDEPSHRQFLETLLTNIQRVYSERAILPLLCVFASSLSSL